MVVSEAAKGFQLTMLGGVQRAAEELLRTRIAPEGSDKTAVLLTVDERYIVLSLSSYFNFVSISVLGRKTTRCITPSNTL